eukprot:5534569-Prymnesium_polylepis.1
MAFGLDWMASRRAAAERARVCAAPACVYASQADGGARPGIQPHGIRDGADGANDARLPKQCGQGGQEELSGARG